MMTIQAGDQRAVPGDQAFNRDLLVCTGLWPACRQDFQYGRSLRAKAAGRRNVDAGHRRAPMAAAPPPHPPALPQPMTTTLSGTSGFAPSTAPEGKSMPPTIFSCPGQGENGRTWPPVATIRHRAFYAVPSEVSFTGQLVTKRTPMSSIRFEFLEQQIMHPARSRDDLLQLAAPYGHPPRETVTPRPIRWAASCREGCPRSPPMTPDACCALPASPA